MSKHVKVVFLAAALLFLGACGGGGGGQVADTGGMGGTGVQVVSNGVMTRGSVIVNGVRYEDTTASISIDDTPKIAANLQDGMVVSVRGTASGSSGTAQSVVAQSEVRGLVTAVFDNENPPRIVVLGQNVLIDDQTVRSPANLQIGVDLIVDTLVEVHGLRDSVGNIRATRVEADIGLMGGDDTVDEIRGVVTNREDATPALFHVGTQEVAFAGATPDFNDGSIVEVHCDVRPICIVAGVFQASRIEVEDFSGPPGTSGVRFEAEGLISGFTLHPGVFFVAGISVTTTPSTRFEGGLADDLLNNIKVEAEGTWNGSTLLANKIEFKRSVIRVQGVVTAQDAGTGTFTLSVVSGIISVNFETDRFTDADAALPANGSPTCVQVRGQRKQRNPGDPVVVIAGEIRVAGCSGGGNRRLLQAPVESEVPEEFITLLGHTINVSAPQDTPPYADLIGNPMTRSAFFSAVTAADSGPPSVAGTLVKINFVDANSVDVDQVELED